MKLVDEGVFLFRTPYSETSLIATFYTRDYGIKKYIFKGGKKKSYNLFPLAISEITFYERKESTLSNLTAVDPVFKQQIQFDAVRSTIAFFIAEALRKSIDNYEKDEDLYHFITDNVKLLDTTKSLSLFPIQFLVGLSEHLGIQPLIEGSRNVINYREGIIGEGSAFDKDCDEGEHIGLLIDLYQEDIKENYPKSVRMKALQAIIKHFSYHIPRMEHMETLEIVHEILS